MVGVAPHVIRNWAARGHIQPVRADGNRTIYDAEEVAKVATRLGHLPELTGPAEACCWPDCGATAWEQLLVPLCLEHTMAIWNGVNEALRARMAPLEEAEPPPVEPVVYFIQVGDRIKIGTTTGLRGRLESVRTFAPQEPKVLLAVPGGLAEERQMHALFAEERVRGEWFRPSERLLQFIAERRDLDVRHVEGVHYLPD
jgi:hypothetical protein